MTPARLSASTAHLQRAPLALALALAYLRLCVRRAEQLRLKGVA